MENSIIDESKIIDESQITVLVANPRSRTGRKRVIGKTTEYGKPVDPNYFKTYYETKYKTPLNCEVCGSLITKYAMLKHQQTKYCIMTGIFKANNNIVI